jgi:hypothetical protein
MAQKKSSVFEELEGDEDEETQPILSAFEVSAVADDETTFLDRKDDHDGATVEISPETTFALVNDTMSVMMAESAEDDEIVVAFKTSTVSNVTAAETVNA